MSDGVNFSQFCHGFEEKSDTVFLTITGEITMATWQKLQEEKGIFFGRSAKNGRACSAQATAGGGKTKAWREKFSSGSVVNASATYVGQLAERQEPYPVADEHDFFHTETGMPCVPGRDAKTIEELGLKEAPRGKGNPVIFRSGPVDNDVVRPDFADNSLLLKQ